MKQKNSSLGCGVIALSFFLLILLIVLVQALFFKGGGGRNKPCVGVVHISGTIMAGTSRGGLLSGGADAGSESVVRALQKGMDDKNVKAIVVRINSPGGSPAGSQEIYQQIMTMRRGGKKPVVISMGDIAASGGYYVAAAGQTIFANPGTLTGSIGVRISYLSFKGLMDKYGVEPVVIKAGKYKDIGSPYRSLTAEEKAIFQKSVENIHEQFIRDVARGRKLKFNVVRDMATGEVFTGEQALTHHLVDRLGGYDDAVAYAARQARIKGRPEILDLQKEKIFSNLLESSTLGRPAGLTDEAPAALAGQLLMVPQLVSK